MPIPEVGGQLQDARIKQVGVFNDLVVEIVLGTKPQGAGLDAHVDVFRHQNDITVRPALLQRVDDTQDLIVSLGRRQARGQGGRGQGRRLQPQASGGFAIPEFVQANTLFDQVRERRCCIGRSTRRHIRTHRG